MKTLQNLAELPALVGHEVAVSDWLTVTQEQVDLFAKATGDHQWIHVDVERAKAGPFGAPIAHGFLTLSLIPRFFETSMEIRNTRMGVNYGLNKVRFTAPVPVGSRLRGPHEAAGLRAHRQRRRADDVAGDRGARGQRQAGVHRGIADAPLSLAATRPGANWIPVTDDSPSG